MQCLERDLATVLSCFLAHVPVSEHAPLLEYSMEVKRNIYFHSILKTRFLGYKCMCQKVH